LSGHQHVPAEQVPPILELRTKLPFEGGQVESSKGVGLGEVISDPTEAQANGPEGEWGERRAADSESEQPGQQADGVPQSEESAAARTAQAKATDTAATRAMMRLAVVRIFLYARGPNLHRAEV
jgi:hypothetical protein